MPCNKLNSVNHLITRTSYCKYLDSEKNTEDYTSNQQQEDKENTSSRVQGRLQNRYNL